MSRNVLSMVMETLPVSRNALSMVVEMPPVSRNALSTVVETPPVSRNGVYNVILSGKRRKTFGVEESGFLFFRRVCVCVWSDSSTSFAFARYAQNDTARALFLYVKKFGKCRQ